MRTAVAVIALLAAQAGSVGAPHRFAALHPGGVLSVVVLPGSGLALTSGADDTALIWDTSTGKPTRRFHGPAFRFQGVAVAAGGKVALTPAAHGARLWSLETGEDVKRFEGVEGTVSVVALSADERLAAAGGFDPAVHVWDARTGERAGEIEVGAQVVALDFVDGGARLAVVLRDGRVCLAPVRDASAPGCTETSVGLVSAAAISPDGRLALAGGGYGETLLWNIARGAVVRRFPDGASEIEALRFSPNGTQAFSSEAKGPMRIWDLRKGRELADTRSEGGVITCAAFSPDGREVLAGSDDGSVSVWRLR